MTKIARAVISIFILGYIVFPYSWKFAAEVKAQTTDEGFEAVEMPTSSYNMPTPTYASAPPVTDPITIPQNSPDTSPVPVTAGESIPQILLKLPVSVLEKISSIMRDGIFARIFTTGIPQDATGNQNGEEKNSYSTHLTEDIMKRATDSSVLGTTLENQDPEYNPEKNSDQENRRTKISTILAQLEQSYNELQSPLLPTPASGLNSPSDSGIPTPTSMIPNQFSPESSGMPTSNFQLPASNLQPTPTIPLPTLVAMLEQALNKTDQPPATSNQLPASGYQPTDDALSSLSVNRQPATGNQILTPSPVIGDPLDLSLPKKHYTIALLGDSMTDTLGAHLPHLAGLLKEAYPDKTFALLNFGQGSTDLESGLKRLTEGTKYLEKYVPPVLSFKPDILVIESFAYNHWGPELTDLNRQWLDFAKMVDAVKKYSPDTRVIFAATVAPNAAIFGDGKLNWDKNKKWESANTTKAYLQNMVNFATSQRYPLADAYHASLSQDGNGYEQYIDPSDHLHPSDMGKMLYAKKIMETIKYNNFIK